jgi:hypothetical protein
MHVPFAYATPFSNDSVFAKSLDLYGIFRRRWRTDNYEDVAPFECILRGSLLHNREHLQLESAEFHALRDSTLLKSPT